MVKEALIQATKLLTLMEQQSCSPSGGKGQAAAAMATLQDGLDHMIFKGSARTCQDSRANEMY